jgi:hypothetical protein
MKAYRESSRTSSPQLSSNIPVREALEKENGSEGAELVNNDHARW